MSRGRHIAPKTRSGRTRWGVLGLVLGLILALSLPAFAGGPAQVSITGGGVALNIDAGAGFVGVGGFNAKLTDGTASGQFQAKTVSDLGVVTARLHGVVTDLCPYTASGADIWEIRIKITKASGDAALLLDFHGSIFVKDNPGGTDQVDEAFELAELNQAMCVNAHATMENKVQGDLKVRDNRP